MFRGANGNDQAAALPKLIEKRRRNGRRGRGNHNRVERCGCRPTGRSVAFFDSHVCVTETPEPFPSGRSQNGLGFDCDHFTGETRQHGSLITASRTDFENALVSLQRQSLNAHRHDEWLGNRLPFADREGFVGVGAGNPFERHKCVPRHRSHGSKYAFVRYAASTKLASNHVPALGFKVCSDG